MEGFFQKLIDLGEEKLESVTPAVATDENCTTVDELRAQVQALRSQLSEQRQQHHSLLEDSSQLRSEYDVYRRKSEAAQRLARQQSAEDKRMLSELRDAGASGKMDVVLLEKTQAQLEELRTQLQVARAEAEQAFKRQREAEEAQRTAEHLKKDEINDLTARFEQYKGTTRQRQARLELQLEQASLASKEEGRGGEAEEKKMNVETTASQPDQASPSEDATGTDSGDHNSSSAEAPHKVASTHANAEVERLQVRVEEITLELMELQQSLAKKSTEVDTSKATIVQLESALEAQRNEAAAQRQEEKKEARRLEDAASSAKEALLRAHQEIESLRASHAAELKEAENRLRAHLAQVGEAAASSKAAEEVIVAERERYEAKLRGRDAVIEELKLAHHGLELDLAERTAEAMQRFEVERALRYEAEQMRGQLASLETRLLQTQQTLAQHEEELAAHESERQRLRAQLQDEDTLRLRQLAEKDDDVHNKGKEEAEWRAGGSARGGDGADAVITPGFYHQHDHDDAIPDLQARIKALLGQNSQLEADSITREALVHHLQAQVAEMSMAQANYLREREQQAARLRLYETREREQRERQMHHRGSTMFADEHGDVADAVCIKAGSGMDMLYTPASANEQRQFVAEAMRSAHSVTLSRRNRRSAIMIGMAMVTLVIMFVSNFMFTKVELDAHRFE